MTAEEWKDVEISLTSPFGRAKFKIDGYTVDVVVEKESPKSLKYVLAVFVDGAIKGKWLVNDCDIRRKFYNKRTESRLTNNYKNSYKFKSLSKKVREEIIRTSTYEYYSPYFKSFRTLKNHFIKNNTSIELRKE